MFSPSCLNINFRHRGLNVFLIGQLEIHDLFLRFWLKMWVEFVVVAIDQ